MTRELFFREYDAEDILDAKTYCELMLGYRAELKTWLSRSNVNTIPDHPYPTGVVLCNSGRVRLCTVWTATWTALEMDHSEICHLIKKGLSDVSGIHEGIRPVRVETPRMAWPSGIRKN